jgi:hypothetical protein
VSQSLATTPGQVYTLDFFLASDGLVPNALNVTWGGNLVLSLSDMPRHDYVHYSVPVLATSPTTLLSFQDRDDPGYLSLDDVTVRTGGQLVGSPEPSSLTLVTAGMLVAGAVGLARNRRRRGSPFA